MRKVLWRRYAVIGKWPFPTDMLRRDYARPATDEDAARIDSLTQESSPDPVGGHLRRHIVNLVSAVFPNIERWKSFGWNVVESPMTTTQPAPLTQAASPAMQDAIRDYVSACEALITYESEYLHKGDEWEELFSAKSEAYEHLKFFV